jgi:hypothetical protein
MKTLNQFRSQINEVLKSSDPIEKWIDDFVHSKNPKFASKSTKERIEMAKGAYYAKQKNESAAESQNSTAEVDMREAKEHHLVHVSDGSKYDEVPHKKDIEHVKTGAMHTGGQFDSYSDKGAFFKFKSKEDAEQFRQHVNKAPHKSVDAEHVNEAVEYKGIGTDVVDKKKKLNPQPNFTTDKKQVKDFKEEVKKSTGDLKKACWKGYTAVGLKMKDGRKVPNCVPEETELEEGKVYDPFTKKMVATKPIKVQAGGGATRNGVPVETGPSKYKSKLPMSKAAGVLAAEEVELIQKHEVKADAPHKDGGHVILSKAGKNWHVLHNKKSSPSAGDLHRSKLLHSYDDEKAARAKFKELKEEQIDELSKDTLASYAKKASKDARIKQHVAADFKSKEAHARNPRKKETWGSIAKKYQSQAWKREDGHNKAVDKLAKEEVQINEISWDDAYDHGFMGHKPTSDSENYKKAYEKGALDSKVASSMRKTEVPKKIGEEVQIDEVSKSTLMRYIPKASRDVGSHTYAGKEAGEWANHYTRAGDWSAAEKHSKKSYADFKKANKRIAGIDMATKKLGTQKEEVELDEAIAKKLPVQHAVDAVHATLGPKSATRFLSHLSPGSDKHTSWDKVNDALVKQGVQTHHIASIAQKTSHMNEEVIDESRGHKVLATFFKNREVAQRAYQGNPAKDAEVAQGGGSPADQGIAAAKADYKKMNKEGVNPALMAILKKRQEAQKKKEEDKKKVNEAKTPAVHAAEPKKTKSTAKEYASASIPGTKRVTRSIPDNNEVGGDEGNQLKEDQYTSEYKIKQFVDPITGENKTRKIRPHRINFDASKMRGEPAQADAQGDYGIKEDGKVYDEKWTEYKGKTFKKESRMLKFNDYLKEAKLSAKQKKIAAVAGDKDKIDADDLAALRAGKKPVEEASCDGKYMKKEELVGNQHKLDKNKNGKLDAHDFKLLRKEETDLDEDVKYIKRKDGKLYAVDDREGPIKNTHLAKDAAYVQTNLTKHLRKHAGLSPDSHVYFDDADLVHGDKTVMHNAIHPKSKHTVGNLVDALKKHVKVHKEEVELDEGRMKDLDYDLKNMGHDEFHKQYGKPKSHYDSTNFKKPVEPGKGMDRARALAQRGMQSLSKEEVERIEEKLTQLDELSKGTLGSYAHKAVDHAYDKAFDDDEVKSTRTKGIERASKKLGDKSISKDSKGMVRAFSGQHKAMYRGDETTRFNRSVDADDRFRQAHDKITKASGVKPEWQKEEVEQIDELSKGTLGSYVKRSTNQAIIKSLANPKDDSDDMKTIAKREKGINLATSKLAKEEVSAEMSPYLKATLKVMDEGKIDNLRDAQKLRRDTQSAYEKDYKPDTSHPHIQVVKGTAYGGENQKDDEGDEKPEAEKEKRGRGRPSGSKSGARLKGGGHEDGGIPVHNLNLPKSYK